MARKARVEMWAISDLRPHPRQAEMFSDLPEIEIRNLARDLARNGQSQPVEITSDGTLICGHQRVLAAKSLGWEEIAVIVRDDLEDAGEAAIEARLVDDNLNRRQLDPLTIARCYRRLKEIERGCNPGELSAPAHSHLRDRIGERLGMSGRNLDRYLRVLDTPLTIQIAVSSGQLPLALAGKVAGLAADVQDEISQRIVDGEQPRAVVQEYITRHDGRHRYVGDAFGSFVKNLERGLSDLQGRVKRIGGQSWAAESLPVLRMSRFVIDHLIRQINRENKTK